MQANKEKVQALMRLSAAEQTATQAFEEMGDMKDQVADLKESLKKVRVIFKQQMDWKKCTKCNKSFAMVTFRTLH